jgi:hypothetical protein
MNIPEWELALKNASLLPELQGVLEGFKHGFDQGIPYHKVSNLRWFTPENHSSAVLAREKIQKSIEEEVRNMRMFGPFSHEEVATKFEFFRSSPLGSVVNADGKMRPINDLSYPKHNDSTPSVNSFVNKADFDTTWDDFKIVSEFFRNSNVPLELALFDWEKAYHQIPTHPSQWPFLMVQDLDGKLYLDTRITFGGVVGCGSFGIPADAWKRIMARELNVVKIFRWVDDNLFIKDHGSSCTISDVVDRSSILGVATNESKCSDFTDEQKFIGFIWNGKLKTVRLPANKLKERLEQIDVFLVPGAQFKYNDAEVLVGHLNHVSYLLPQLRAYLRGIYRWMNQWKKPMAWRTVPEDVTYDLNFCKSTLTTFENTRLVCSKTPVELGWVGDASTSFGIGILIGHRWSQFRLKETWRNNNPPRGIAWLETVAIRLGLIMLKTIGLVREGTNCIVWTDNTVTGAVLSSKKSKDPYVNDEWKVIQSILVANNLDLTPKRVVSKDNKADTLSRGIQAPHVKETRVWVDIPHDLCEFMFHTWKAEKKKKICRKVPLIFLYVLGTSSQLSSLNCCFSNCFLSSQFISFS